MKKGIQDVSILVKGRLLDLNRPIVMGIINVTRDSFFSGSRANEQEEILNLAGKHLEQGASILDIGAYSSRPGAFDVPIEEELERAIFGIETILKVFPEAILSIDTFRAKVASAAIESGASIINDISAAEDDIEMPDLMSTLNVPVILMHKQGKPSTMQLNPEYEDVSSEVISYLLGRSHFLRSLGVRDIIWDPGFGFGKTLEHNYQLLKQIGDLSLFGYPVLAGLSRKSMITRVLDIPNLEALNGSTALHMLALQGGARILRVHDVKEAVQCIRLYEKLLNTEIP